MAWAGANNIEAGVTIDLGLMTTTTYNPDTKVASLQPGGTWAQVYSELEKCKKLRSRRYLSLTITQTLHRWSYGRWRP